MDNCKICNESFPDSKHLHFHLRSHKTTQEEYYKKFYPRTDLLTGFQIPFINHEQYFEQDFTDKENLLTYLKNCPNPDAREYIRGKLESLSSKKGLKFAPNQIYLKSYGYPSVIALDRILGDYYAFCESLNCFQKQFSRPKVISTDDSYFDDAMILVDTREKTPLSFPGQNAVIKGLKFGDYAIIKDGEVNELRIERKSLMDLIGTLSRQMDRFVAELTRAREVGSYIVVLVEENLERSLMFDAFKHISQHTKIRPAFIFHQVRQLIQEFDNLQFLFVRGRGTAASTLLHLYKLKDKSYRTLDLQWAHDSMLLT